MQADVNKLMDAVGDGRDLAQDETARVFDALMAGRLPEDRVERFIIALSDKGETLDEIVGAATVMRRHVTRIECDAPRAIDTCGTGGDGISTFNVSTAAAVIAAGAGATVAKHGNRSNSRKSGSAEVLAALGVNIDAPPAVVTRCIRDVGIGFLFAARLHPAMKHVVAIRRRIGRPTLFNLLGPLTNPAFVKRQIIGVPQPELMDKMSHVLARLGSEHALVVHGHDGLCDLTITDRSSFSELRDGRITHRTVEPEALGLVRGRLDDLRIADPEESAAVIRAILDGEPGPRRDHTLLNAAAALTVAGVADGLRDGVRRAAQTIDRGAAAATLRRLITASASSERG